MAEANTFTLFPVGNGDMFLFQVGEKGRGKTILIDMNIRDSTEDNELNAIEALHQHLPKSSRGAPYVDLLVITHPDKDHINGFSRHFFSGSPDKWEKVENGYSLIIANEIWFSEICTKRINKDRRLTSCGKALRDELKRRRQLFEDKRDDYEKDGNRLKVIGLDEEQEDTSENWYLPGLVIDRHEETTIGNAKAKAYILAPFTEDFYSEENSTAKNESSIIIRWTINGSDILLGGDATNIIWEKVNDDNANQTDKLKYDILVAPHHCSWGVLGTGSKKKNIPYELNKKAKRALSHCRDGAYIISSSRPFGDQTPPHLEAKEQYLEILNDGNSTDKNFVLLSEKQTSRIPPKPTTFLLSKHGVIKESTENNSGKFTSNITSDNKPIKHA